MDAYVIRSICNDMEVGQQLQVSGRNFHEAFNAWGFPTIYNNPTQVFLSSMIGAAWGVIRVHHEPFEDQYIISKHEESDKRYYVDPDREDLFEKLSDGTYERRVGF